MKIAIIPMDIAWGNKEENLITAAEKLRHVHSDTDVAVLPEMFTTGFIRKREQLRELAETNDGHTIDDVHRWAAFFKFAVVGSFMACDKARTRFYNRAFFIEPSGDETFYDKHHLFIPGGEGEAYTPGGTVPPIIRYMGWDFALAICYDMRFPEWLRNRDSRYEVLLMPASWPESRRLAWDILLRARAVENQAYAIGANRIGHDPGGEYMLDSSMVIDPMGRLISTIDRQHGIIYAELDHEALRELRRRLPALEHQDRFRLDGEL